MHEPLRRGLVEGVAGIVGGEVEVVQRLRAAAAVDRDVSAVQHHPYLAGDPFLGLGHEGLQRGLQRGEPQAVVDQFGPAPVGGPLEPAEFALQRHVLEFGVGGDQRHRARRLVDLPALDTDQPVLDDVETAHALGAGPAVQFDDGLQDRDRVAVDGHRPSAGEADDHLVRGVEVDGRVFGVVVHVLGGGVPQVFQEAGLHRAAPDVLVDRERRALGDVDRNRVVLGERDGLLPGPGVVADRCQHLQIRRERGEPDLEAHLVVALAGAAVRDHTAVVLPCRGDQVLDDQWPA